MKKLSIFSCVMLLFFGFAGMANATLWDRGGGLIYDDVLDITWLQDANYAETSGYDDDGLMKWPQAKEWADNLIYYDSVRKLHWNDWRLPHALPLNPPNYNYELRYDGSSDRGYNITTPNSEMSYMSYVNLGNLAYFDKNGNIQPGWGLNNMGPFINIQTYVYWSENSAPDVNPDDPNAYAWTFGFHAGNQNYLSGWFADWNVWAVRDGDVLFNDPPTADAGPNQTVDEGTSVALDASGSYDPDTAITYQWSQIDGPTVSLDMPDPVHPTFNAPWVAVEGTVLTFELTVSDGNLASDPDWVDITVSLSSSTSPIITDVELYNADDLNTPTTSFKIDDEVVFAVYVTDPDLDCEELVITRYFPSDSVNPFSDPVILVVTSQPAVDSVFFNLTPIRVGGPAGNSRLEFQVKDSDENESNVFTVYYVTVNKTVQDDDGGGGGGGCFISTPLLGIFPISQHRED